MNWIRNAFEEARDWWQAASVKLAALVAIVSSAFTANPELLVGLIGVIPVDPFVRLVFAAGVGAVVFLVPVITRLWPQNAQRLHKREGKVQDDG